MGVHQLWNILESVKRKETLSSLIGKALCVDLSGWICEAQCAKGLKANVSKPHLRNLFFRVMYLTRLGIKLVFVVDGKAPELKWEAIAKRTQARFGAQVANKARKRGGKVGRSNFDVWVNECCELLKLLGIPHIKSPGEAEAMCAWLDSDQFVDGCITSDGDAFLYGARTVYRDLHIGNKDALVESYSMTDIESELNLDRRRLVALAILLGCDYLPQGVHGVGKENALKLSNELKGHDLLDRFHAWTQQPTSEDSCLSNIEKTVKRKALADRNFPNDKVIQEFLTPNAVPKKARFEMRVPDLGRLQEFCLKYMEWPTEYTQEKVFPLATYWQMNKTENDDQGTSSVYIEPDRILKARVQQRVECYEVQWRNVALGETCPASFVTMETRQRIGELFPAIVEEFNLLQEAKSAKSGKQRKRKPKQSCNDGSEADILARQLETLSLDTKTDKHQKAAAANGETSSSKEQTNAVDRDDAPLNATLQKSVKRGCKPDSAYLEYSIRQLPRSTSQSDLYPQDVFEDPVGEALVGADELQPSKFSMSLLQRLSMKDQTLQRKSLLQTSDRHSREEDVTVTHCSDRNPLRRSTSQTASTSSDRDTKLPRSFPRHSSSDLCETSYERQEALSADKTELEQVLEDKTSRSETQRDWRRLTDETGLRQAALNSTCFVQGQSTSKKTSQVSKNHKEQGRPYDTNDMDHVGLSKLDYGRNVEHSNRNYEPTSVGLQRKARNPKPARKIFLKMEFSDSSCTSSDEEVNASVLKRETFTANTNVQTRPGKEHSLETFSCAESVEKVPEFTKDGKRVAERTFNNTDEGKAAFIDNSNSWLSLSCLRNSSEGQTHEITEERASEENSSDIDDSVSPVFLPAPLSQRLNKRLVSKDALRTISLSNTSSDYTVHSQELYFSKSAKECTLSSGDIKKRSLSVETSRRGEREQTASNGKALKDRAKATASGSCSSPIMLY